jgi:hypothetical protein
VVERVESESFRLFCPELTNPLPNRRLCDSHENLKESPRTCFLVGTREFVVGLPPFGVEKKN